jgi:hypothetical protein
MQSVRLGCSKCLGSITTDLVSELNPRSISDHYKPNSNEAFYPYIWLRVQLFVSRDEFKYFNELLLYTFIEEFKDDKA